MKNPPRGKVTAVNVAIVVMAVIAVATVGYVMRSVLLPIVLAVFFAALGRPLQVRLQRYIGEGLALAATVVVVGATLVALPLVFAANMQVVIERLPVYAPRMNEAIADLERFAHNAGFDFKIGDLTSDSMVQTLLGMATDALSGLLEFLGTVALIIFILIFMLGEANILKAKLASALRPTNHAAVLESFSIIQERIQQYVTTKTLFAALDAIACGIITWALGIDFPALWVLLTFTLYFIPNLGAIIAVVPPVLVALIQFPTATTAIAAFLLLSTAFIVLGNIVEPRFLGRAMSLSPLVVFLSLLLWGWYLGVIGVVLSVPLTVVIRIICQHVEPLHPVAIMMSNKAGVALHAAEVSDGDLESG